VSLGGGRVAGLVRVTGGLVIANAMWATHALTLVRFSGATAALYSAVRTLRAGGEPVGWRAFSGLARSYQRSNPRLTGYAAASMLSMFALLAMALHSVGIAGGVLVGWASVLASPTVAFALISSTQPAARAADRERSWAVALCGPVVSASPIRAFAVSALHIAMILVLVVVPEGAVVLVGAVAVALPAYLGSLLFDRRTSPKRFINA
jgi:hypothetical protein